MSIVYALIARKKCVLAEYTDKSGNFPTVRLLINIIIIYIISNYYFIYYYIIL